jgi:oxygen-independent coproporphyrinogen-3 oxidase
MVHALAKEAAMEKDYAEGEKINTIYFGGGTPSLLSIEDCQLLIGTIRKNYAVETDAEITLEANADDIRTDKLKAWKDAGINRVSIGIQSFYEEELKWMNRAHNAVQARENLEQALKEFNNVTIDLIYGSPLLTDEMWKHNVDTAISYGIPHLSCYALTVEEKTPLHKNILNFKTKNVDSDKQSRQFQQLMEWLRDKGYEHYEVSNFALPGFRSRHNSSYWKGEKYLGLGPSAHSFNGSERRWNIANNSVYIKSVKEGSPKRETEMLTDSQKLNEYVMISLRTMEGLNLELIESKFGKDKRERIEKQLKKFIENDLIIIDKPYARLTDQGMLVADGIASDLFEV